MILIARPMHTRYLLDTVSIKKKHKLAPFGTEGRLLLTANFRVT